MKKILFFNKKLFNVVLLAGLLFPIFSQAANVLLANKPLVDSAPSDVLPNLMFIIDDSGSMNFDYTPDWSSSSNALLRKNSAYNTQYYNPNIVYMPAVKFDGVSMGNQDPAAAKNGVTETGATKGGTTNLVGNASYYGITPGEYCKAQDLKDCTISNVKVGAYQFPAPIRWCNSALEAIALTPALNTCRSVREDTFINLRAPSSTATITFSTGGGANTNVTNIKVNGLEILNGTVSTNSTNTMATNVRNGINACTNAMSGNCQINGYSAIRTGSLVTIISPYGGASITFTPVVTKAGGITASISGSFAVRTPGSLELVDIKTTTPNYALPGSAAKGSERDDCLGTVCTYAEEITNYANWHTYYKTRLQGMKSSASLAFKGINNRYKVGFISIHNLFYLKVAKFDAGAGNHKDLWYTKLFSVTANSGTPLRSSLSTVGRIFAGKDPLGIGGVRTNFDPVEYACQPNFALLTTDGYWNTDADADAKDVDGNPVGNRDGDATPRPKYDGGGATSNTLADIAKYYADTDLRSSTAFTTGSNCTGALGANVCGEETGNEENKEQNLTTLTLGLGIDGTKLYSSSYKTDTTGDFPDIKSPSGIQNWPDPIVNSDGERIDDLWHAAVNGNGTYFSARDPKQLTDSLRKALSDITSKVGAGSAAAASSLQPTAGDNFNYVASYATNKWIGNLEARKINLTDFTTDIEAQWCVEDVAKDACEDPAGLVLESGVFSCKTPGSDAAKCSALGGTLSAANDCRVPVIKSCTGKMASQVAAGPTGRSIMFNSGTNTGPVLLDFFHSNLDTAKAAYFNTTSLGAKLAQWGDLTTTQQTNAAGAGIVNYLRGQKNLEDTTSNPADDRLFRQREATLGDITESQPAFIAQPKFRYTDPGYDGFKTAQATRPGAIYVGANDGMLHAFYAKDQTTPTAPATCAISAGNYCGGQEIWAYIPTPVLPKMAKLADRDYAVNHINLVNGDPTIAEVCILGSGALCASATSSDWRTVLVGGLNGGGRGYYAMDITNPKVPKLLWEFTTATAGVAGNLGYSFGAPIVTKLNDGRWVALLTSGYNNGAYDSDGVTANIPTGGGGGHLYVVDIKTGVKIKDFPTGAGTSTSPSGLGQIAAFAQDVIKNNLATYVYGGDLEGNLWRFDVNAADGTAPLKLATLRGPTKAQPITTTPQLGVINKKTVIFVGTGKYLEGTDLDPTTDIQTLYAIRDDGVFVGDPRSAANAGNFVAQTINKTSRVVTPIAVNFATMLGWRVDLPDDGERFSIDSLLVNGVLLAPTTVPKATTCSPGGYGWFNYFNYKTGGAVISSGVVSEKLNSPAVGFNLIYDANGKPVVTVVESNDPTPHLIDKKDIASGSGSNRTTLLNQNPDGTYGRKSIWRELIR